MLAPKVGVREGGEEGPPHMGRAGVCVCGGGGVLRV
jgi:hypothetical protein